MTYSTKHFAYAILLGATITLMGCPGGGKDGDSGKGATVPANAITITAVNAETTVASAVESKGMATAFGIASAPDITLKQALELVKKIRTSVSATQATATGITQTENCTGGGTITASYTVSGNTDSGSIKLNNCIEDGFTLNGTLNYSDTYDPSTTVYSNTSSGSLSVAGTDMAISFNGLDFAINGNENNRTYTITKYIVAVDFTTNGTTGGGFLVELTAPIVESTGDLCPESGAIKVTGANGTTAELIYNGNGTATIKANGVVVKSSAQCYT